MSLLQTIKAAQLQARKARDTIASNVLTTLIGEAEAIGKNAGNRETTDAEVVAIAKKFIKNMDETIALIKHPQALADLQRERSIVERYLPKQLTGVELIGILESLINELNAHTLREMGKIMKVLKERYDGQYDGATASALIKGMLT
jgi:uncharacterized protein YqeY